jgi:hypothetical protein
MTIDLSAHLNKRTSLNVGRNSAIFFAFALSTAASLTPARALVPAAPAWARSAEINQLVIIEVGFRATKQRRLARAGNCRSTEIDNANDCTRQPGCKWQKAGRKSGIEYNGYCYPSAPGVAKPLVGHKAQ